MGGTEVARQAGEEGAMGVVRVDEEVTAVGLEKVAARGVEVDYEGERAAAAAAAAVAAAVEGLAERSNSDPSTHSKQQLHRRRCTWTGKSAIRPRSRDMASLAEQLARAGCLCSPR